MDTVTHRAVCQFPGTIRDPLIDRTVLLGSGDLFWRSGSGPHFDDPRWTHPRFRRADHLQPLDAAAN